MFGDGAHKPAPGLLADGAHEHLADIVRERARQIEKFGHTAQRDAALPLAHLPKVARQLAHDAAEDCQFHRPDWRKHARRHLIAAAATILAALDRLDAEPEQQDFTL